ncbi:DEAD/DEAH box helicase [Ruminococcus albus]|uniref:Type III restriction enzyme n=1 Tax=Ruminococcus albus TaxID=1264 RepID=A0A1H7LHB1_RUMAL|nr:DEAD/DEAH box helicase family protein [Ruminococcus albus]SEK98334.1 type III restriction enzyme [Ruminococcus albus]
MINELFPFQKQAVADLRSRVAIAMNTYSSCHIPQVVSLQAPTGSGKTIIMSALIEDILFGNELYPEQPEAIFVWLSDSPQLNEQSKQKIDNKADKIRMDQCVVITDENFDSEMLEEGHIYFLNTQKLGSGGNLGKHSDSREYTIWETIENTAREKSDRLYFIIDEAHRGMQGRAAGTATTIMQRFIKGSAPHNLSPVPVVIGMSATSERFNNLVGDTSSTLQKVVVPPAQVRASGLLKDRIVITYPEDPTKHNDMAVLQAATDEWINKCAHWYQYTYEQHYANVNPVFVVQVLAGSGKKVSDNDLSDIISKIEERLGDTFKEGEVVHTFGSVGNLEINGLNVPHVEPAEIADNRVIRVVLFKENLSTGWDCPRAETMMSFRRAEDATYIAQLLGRMVRTPLQSHILVDDSLNDVRLYLPYFNKDNVQKVISELQSSEGGEIPTEIDGESLEEQEYVPWSVHASGHKNKKESIIPGQLSFSDYNSSIQMSADTRDNHNITPSSIGENVQMLSSSYKAEFEDHTHNEVSFNSEKHIEKQASDSTMSYHATSSTPIYSQPAKTEQKHTNNSETVKQVPTNTLFHSFDREEVIDFINQQGFLTYMVRFVKTNSYLKSLLDLSGLLTQYQIAPNANDEIKNDVTSLMRAYIDDLHNSGKYNELMKQVMEFKLTVQIFDVFGEEIKDFEYSDLLHTAETDLDRQLRAADTKLGKYGFTYTYGRKYLNFEDPNEFKVDCILFAADDECIKKLNKYAEKKFHDMNDKYRKYVVNKSEKCRKQYSDIVADGDIISKHNFTLPETISAKVEKDGIVYDNHLFADENGKSRIKLNNWEKGVLEEEQNQPDFVCWLRNPPRKPWSLCIPYENDNTTKAAYPDFIIVKKDEELGYVMDILEPHNPDFDDNLGKAKGFANYAEEEKRIGRLQLIRTTRDAAGKERFIRLDMAKGSVRKKVLAAINNDELDHIFDTDGEFLD